jgi:hypothetical protein
MKSINHLAHKNITYQILNASNRRYVTTSIHKCALSDAIYLLQHKAHTAVTDSIMAIKMCIREPLPPIKHLKSSGANKQYIYI